MALEKPEFTKIPLTVDAAKVLLHWLSTVPNEAVPVSHPAERQALADLLTALEMTVVEAGDAGLSGARERLTRASGDWINDGPMYGVD